MHVRQIQKHELSDLLALYSHLHTTDSPLPEPSIVQAIWQELLTNPRYQYFGGYVDNNLISSCTLTVVPNLTRSCKPYGIIENVVTHASYRNKGHGKAVLTHALCYAWSVDCYKVMLLTGRQDQSTLKFYESVGFDRHKKQAFIAEP